MDIRFVDLMPDAPLGDDGNVLEIYADSIASLKLHGMNFTTTYFVWGRNGPFGLVQRVPVVKIIRPYASLLGSTLATFMGKGKPVLN